MREWIVVALKRSVFSCQERWLSTVVMTAIRMMAKKGRRKKGVGIGFGVGKGSFGFLSVDEVAMGGHFRSSIRDRHFSWSTKDNLTFLLFEMLLIFTSTVLPFRRDSNFMTSKASGFFDKGTNPSTLPFMMVAKRPSEFLPVMLAV